MKELEAITDIMTEISPETFLKHVPLYVVNNVLMYGCNYPTQRSLIHDYCVTFYRAKRIRQGIDAYVMKHSGIEYVFKHNVIRRSA